MSVVVVVVVVVRSEARVFLARLLHTKKPPHS